MNLETVLEIESKVAGMPHYTPISIPADQLYELCEVARKALQPEATPNVALRDKVAKFADLSANWDSYGAEAFPERTIILAMEVAVTLDDEWKCLPCADGPSVWFYRGNEEDIIEVRTSCEPQ